MVEVLSRETGNQIQFSDCTDEWGLQCAYQNDRVGMADEKI